MNNTDINIVAVIVCINSILHLFLEKQVQNHACGSRDGKASLHDEDNGIEEALERLVSARISKNVVEIRRHQSCTVAEGQAGSEDEAVPAGEGHATRYDCDARNGHRAEEERGHAAQDGWWDGDEGSSKLCKDAHDKQEEAAGIASSAVGAAGEGDDAVVLRKGAHWRYGHEGCETAVEAVGQDSSLDARLEYHAIDFKVGDVAGGGDVSNGLSQADDEDGQHWEHQRAVDG